MMDTQRTEVAPQVLEQVQQYVAEYCPDLADAEYSVQTRQTHTPSDEMLSKVQVTPPDAPSQMNEVRERRPAYMTASPTPQANGRTAVASPSAAPHYTITLRKNVRTDNGALLPRIARFVVDGSGQILKATASKLAARASKLFEAGEPARLYCTSSNPKLCLIRYTKRRYICPG